MGFYEEIADALDNEGIESRVNDGTLFVPISQDVEVQFVALDAAVPAANVFVAEFGEEQEDAEQGILVGAVFSVDAAVAEVNRHMVTDQMLTLMQDLLEGTDDRINDVDFYPNPDGQGVLLTADVAADSYIDVSLSDSEGVPKAKVSFRTYGEELGYAIDDALSDIFGDEQPSEEELEETYSVVVPMVEQEYEERLELGEFEDFDRLFDVLRVAIDHAEEWENLMDTIVEED